MSLENKAELKTLDGWYKFAEENDGGSWENYCKIGDLADEECYKYFLNVMPPHIMRKGYLQTGEPYGYRANVKTGKYQETYITFVQVENGIWRYCGHCFSGEVYDTDVLRSAKSIKEFMKATYFICFGMQKTRPRIICRDGFSISVQAGTALYSTPREDLENGEYEAYEIGFPSQVEELLVPFAEENYNFTEQVYPYVPTEIVEQVIEKHGGIYNGI